MRNHYMIKSNHENLIDTIQVKLVHVGVWDQTSGIN